MITDRDKYIMMVTRQRGDKEPNYSPEEIRERLEQEASKQNPEKIVKKISS